MSRAPLRVGIAGCGLIGRKRAEALGEEDVLGGCFDPVAEAAAGLAAEHGAEAFDSLGALLDNELDVVVVAAPHDQLAGLAERALDAGCHVLLEKPAGLGTAQIERLREAAARAGRRVKVGFNHRFHPGIARAAEEVHSGRHGELMHLRGRYGHGGRIGYDREWRADPTDGMRPLKHVRVTYRGEAA